MFSKLSRGFSKFFSKHWLLFHLFLFPHNRELSKKTNFKLYLYALCYKQAVTKRNHVLISLVESMQKIKSDQFKIIFFTKNLILIHLFAKKVSMKNLRKLDK